METVKEVLDDNSNSLNKKKSVKKNYIYNLIYQAFLLIVPLVVTPYISRVLLPDGVGKYSFAYSLITYFTIFGSLGFGYYAQREIAKHQQDKYNQTKAFWEIVICRLIPVIISLLVNIVLCFTSLYGDYKELMWIFSINIIALAFDIVFLFQGNEEFGRIVLRNVLIKSLSIAAIFIFVKQQGDLNKYAFINSIMLIVSNISLWVNVPKMICKIKIKELKPLTHLKGTIRLFIPTIATSIYTVLDRTLIGLLITDTYTVIEDGIMIVKRYADLENGYYEQSEKLVKMVMVIITSIGTVMIPRNSNEIANGNIEKVRKNINLSSRLVFLIGMPMVLGFVGIASNIVPWFYGAGYDKCVLLISILAPLIVIIGLSNVFGLQYLVPSGKDKKFTIALLLGALTNVIFNCILIPHLWSLGAAIGTIIAEMVVTITMAIMVRKEVNLLKVIIESWRPIIASIAMFLVVFGLSFLFESGIIYTIILGVSGVFTYMVLLLIFKDPIIFEGIRLVLNKIKRRG